LSSATVKFVGGYVPKKDTLTFVPIGVIKGKFVVRTGTLTLTGVASPADYEAALRTVKYINNSPQPVDGIRTIAFQLKDVAGSGDPVNKLLSVIGVNTKPTATLTSAALIYKSRGKFVAGVAGNLKITDLDNTRLQSARVEIVSGFEAGADELMVTIKAGSGLSATYVNGVLTITGNATLATYLAVLKSLKFKSSLTALGGNRILSFTVNDGLLDSTAVTRMVMVV
jgi:hypothetical protein